MDWKRAGLAGILVLLVVIGIVLVYTLVYTLNNKEVPKPELNGSFEKSGTYSDENGSLLGACTEKYDESFTEPGHSLSGWYSYSFYDLQGNLLGSCFDYVGVGSSGWKGGCDDNSVENNIATRITDGPYAGRATERYRCETG